MKQSFCNGIVMRDQPADGPRVLWIHGYTLDSTLWADLWERLPEWHHVAIDLPGHGQSAPIPGGMTIGTLAMQLADAARQHNITHLVGLSFGSLIALQMAIVCPEQFTTVSLGAAGIIGGPEDPHTPRRYGELYHLFARRGAGRWMRECWMQSPPDIFTAARAHPQLWSHLETIIDRHTWDEFRTGAMRHMIQPPQTPAMLGQIQSPMTLFLGDADMPAFVAAAQQIQAAVPTCHIQPMANAGHLCLIERPAEAARHLQSLWRTAEASVPA